MNTARYANIFKGLVAIGIVALVWFPDVAWELFVALSHFIFEVFHLIFEVFHIIFEMVEISLDFLIEHLLETAVHTTEIIVFYLIMAMILFLVYGLFQWLRGAYRRWWDAFMAKLKSLKMGVKQMFQGMNMAEKASWLALVVVAVITRMLLGF